MCIGDCGRTPFEGGTPIKPHIKVLSKKVVGYDISNNNKKRLLKSMEREHLFQAAYHDPKQQDIVMISRRVFEIKFLLLRHLCGYAMIEKVQGCYHHGWYYSTKNVWCWNLYHILQSYNTSNYDHNSIQNIFNYGVFKNRKTKGPLPLRYVSDHQLRYHGFKYQLKHNVVIA